MDLEEEIKRKLRRFILVAMVLFTGSLAALGQLAMTLKTQAKAAAGYSQR